MNPRLNAIMMLAKNVTRGMSCPRLTDTVEGDYTFRGFRPSDLPAIAAIYSEDDGSVLPRYNRLLLKLCGGRLCLVATKDSKVIGFDQFYFNDRDLKENTVHEGYVAVAKAHSGRGLASAMRRICAKQFKEAGFSGISTRISQSNRGSMASALKVGFRSIEDYIDPDTSEQRSYLLMRL